MKKINITFSFRDETGDYSVKVFPFVIKCIVSVIVVFNFIVIAMALPGEISDHVKYSGKEYYKSRCEEKYIDREFDSLHDYLNLYHLQGEDYGIYWEMVNGYEDYTIYMNYKSMEEQENISFSCMGKYDQPQEISFMTSQKIEEYRNKVLENAENVKYERNKRYLTEFAQKVQ